MSAPTGADGWDTRSKILADLADVSGHLEFVEGLLARHELAAEERSRIERDLGRVRRRQADPVVTMAVVGEFSAGKSSFINALLREELFETDAVQGTTTASTVIEYGPERTLTVSDDTGTSKRAFAADQTEELRAELTRLTVRGERDAGDAHVALAHPSEFLRAGIRIADTPGTGSLSQWHDEVTRRAVREEADGCIVLTPAVQPLSQTLRDFLRDELSDQLSTCVFVLTKIDLVRPRERGRVTAFARRVLADELDLPRAPVLTYCSLPEAEGFAEENLATEGAILGFLRERRVQLQLTSCTVLLERILAALGRDMAQLGEERAAEHERLVEATTRELAPFVEAHRRETLSSVQRRIEQERQRLLDQIDALVAAETAQVMRRLDACTSQILIRGFLSHGIGKQLREGGERIVSRLAGGSGTFASLERIRCVAEEERERFERDFLDRYRTLDALSRELELSVSIPFSLGDKDGGPDGTGQGLAQLALDNSVADTSRFAGGIAGGAAAGAAIGSVVPGLGTVIGAGVGGLVGYLGWNYSSHSPRQVERFRDEVRDSVSEAAASYFSALRGAILRTFGACANQAGHALDRLMDDYLTAYGHVIEALREHDLAEQERLERELELIRNDEDLIRHRMELLRATLARFHEL